MMMRADTAAGTCTAAVIDEIMPLIAATADDAPPPPPPPPATPPPSPAFISAGLHLSAGKASIYGPLLSDPASRAAATVRLRRTVQRLGDPRFPSDETRAQALLRGDGSTVAPGHPVLGTPIGTDTFVESSVAESAARALRLISILTHLLRLASPASPSAYCDPWPLPRHLCRL